MAKVALRCGCAKQSKNLKSCLLSYGNLFVDLSNDKQHISDLGLFNGRSFIGNEEEDINEVRLVRADDPFKRELARQVGKTLTKLRIHIEDQLSFMGEISQYDKFSTDKVKQLLRILAPEEDLQNQADMTAIVFVQERTMTMALASLLIKLTEMQPNLYGHLKVNFSNPFNFFSLTLLTFLSKKFDCIVIQICTLSMQ